MGIKFLDWLIGRRETSSGNTEVSCQELYDALEEYRIREIAFKTCVSMIANAVGKCEFKTYIGNKERKGEECYLWNFEPNTNQNSTAFLHKLIYRLYEDGEALVISTKRRDGKEMLAVADSYQKPLEYPAKMQEYDGVVVGEVQYSKTFKESEVLHFRLQEKNIKPVLDAMYQSYNRLIVASMKNYEWANGKHMKVHVNQIASADKDFQEKFREMMERQVKPFMESKNAVLPEFEGYQYENMGGSADANRTTRDIRSLVDDIFDFTARAFCIPPVLLFGDVAGTQDAMQRWLTTCIDPLCDQLQEEIVRKRYGFERWAKGDFLKIDTTTILHVDMFANADKIEKLIGSAVYSINDVITALGGVEIMEDWANEHYMTLNISKIDDVAQAVDGKGGE